jgi:hypothetical protein
MSPSNLYERHLLLVQPMRRGLSRLRYQIHPGEGILRLPTMTPDQRAC